MSELTAKIEDYYSNLRFQAESKAERCLNRALQNKDFAAINRAYLQAKFSLFRAESQNADSLDALRSDVLQLREKRSRCLAELGLTEEDIVAQYTCKDCHDTGFLPDGSACHCYRSLVSRLKLEELGVSAVPFHRFSEADPALTPYIPFHRYQREYCDVFPQGKQILVFSGATGTGKSFLASCIAGELEDKGRSVLFLSAFALNRYFMQCFEAESYKGLWPLVESDLLVIDDLGAEPVYRKITVEYLKNLIDERLARRNPLIITTNLGKDALLERYTERITSRLFDGKLAQFNGNFQGKDLRVK